MAYQKGFQEGESTLNNITNVLRIFKQETRLKKKRMGVLLVDFKKAFDSIDRRILFSTMWDQAKSDKERSLFKVIYKLFANTAFDFNGINKNKKTISFASHKTRE
jgi:hypothetical protein